MQRIMIVQIDRHRMESKSRNHQKILYQIYQSNNFYSDLLCFFSGCRFAIIICIFCYY